MALPAEFADLEPYADWILPTEPQRYDKRLASSMEQMQAFYDVAFPRMEQALAYLGDTPLEDLSEPERNLLYLMQSLVMVSFPIELWRQPRVPDTGAAYLDLIVEPVVA
ncbi:hypothetical protein [Blastococcus sp. URHD0036]|uniref:hypothetical protein n=1 Tax=Blastococcus sp. URHD0036 TaxID=1380356 RepID=UPI0004968EC4|nr:hypothetical protein [Blastococcus sp. URHD0036]